MITEADWTAAQAGNTSARNKLMLHYQPLVSRVAVSMAKGMPPHVDQDDLKSSAQFGLMDAISKYDTEAGVRFESFAVRRIRGSILDELRNQDWAPRSVRSKERTLSSVIEEVSQMIGRDPTEADLVEHSDLTIADIRSIQSSTDRSNMFSLDAPVSDDSNSDSFSDMTSRSDDQDNAVNLSDFADAMEAMDELESVVISSHYYLGKSLADIGKMLEVTESRVCQIHTKALKKIRKSVQRL